MDKGFCVIGSDKRQLWAKKYLQKLNYKVLEQKNFSLADFIIFPLPLSTEQVLFERVVNTGISPVVFAGKIDPSEQELAAKRGIILIDYLEREDFVMLNAIPSSEGALLLIMQHLKTTIWGTNVLVTGFGRIAQLLAKMLFALGANVTISARNKAQIAQAQSLCYHTCKICEISAVAKTIDVVVNTVPALVVDEKILSLLHHEAYILDLASAPGGIDQNAARRKGFEVDWALGIPASYSPVTAGGFVAQTVVAIINEKGY